MTPKMLLYSDGGARGNPGPAAIAFIAQNELSQTIKTDTRYIGIHTNNQAEYEALLLALKFATSFGAQDVICHLDSELVVKQINGEYAVKNSVMRLYWCKVKELQSSFVKIAFVNVRRTNPHIAQADALVNRTLDAQTESNLR